MSVIANKFGQFTFLHIEHLTHSKGIIFFKCLFLHFLQEVTYTIGGLQHFNTGHQTIITIRGKGGEGGILFDIDNTIVPHGAPADERARKLFEKLRGIGFRYCFVSNNQKPRVEPFAKAVEGNFIENAHKPAVKNYKKACQVIQTEPDRTIFVGDQLFTDIYGAKRAGIRTILVKPIHPKEEIQIVLKRYLEKIVLHFYKKEEGIS